jgi:hypothetical protein
MLGCPLEIRPLAEFEAASSDHKTVSDTTKAGAFYKSVFEELFPDLDVSEAIGASRCVHFPISAEKIRERRKSDSEH